jgi:hypothetical protein
MTDYLAEIKRLLWKSKQPDVSEFWQGFYKRRADSLQKEYDRLQEKK